MQFRSNAVSPHHERYSFPFFTGSYFAYRKVDVLRIVAIAKSIATKDPLYVDIGCGYGDFLDKIREHLPRTIGIEKEGSIFYAFQVAKPDYIHLMPTES